MAIKEYEPRPIQPLLQTESQPPKEEQPAIPPPVEPPEYYQGYRKELEDIGRGIYQQEKTLRTVQERRLQFASNPSLQMLQLTRTPDANFPLSNAQAELANKQYQQYLATVDKEVTNQTSNEWRYTVLNMMPTLMLVNGYKGSGMNTPEDVLKIIPNQVMTESDAIWLTDTFKKLEHLKPKLPEGFAGTVEEAQKKLIGSMQEERKLPLTTVSGKTAEELAKYFSSTTVTKLPEGMTAEEARTIISYLDLPDEDKQQIDAFIETNMTAWKVEANRLNLIRQGLALPDPSSNSTDFMKMLLVQPMAGTVALLDKLWNVTTRPALTAAILSVNFKGVKSDTYAGELERLYVDYKSKGESPWSALSLAYNAWKAPGPDITLGPVEMGSLYKMFAETAFDPTTYLGLGVYTKMVDSAGVVLLKAIGKSELYTVPKLAGRTAYTKVGQLMEAFETGFNRLSDTAFKVGMEGAISPVKATFWALGAGYQIPKTITQLSRNFARLASSGFSAALKRAYPTMHNLVGLTAKDVDDVLIKELDAAVSRPWEGMDFDVFTGGKLLEPEYLDSSKAKVLLKDLAEDIEWDTPSLARLNDNLLYMTSSGLGERSVAGTILTNLGKETTDEAVEALSKRLINLKKTFVKEALARASGNTAKDKIINLFEELQKVRYKNLSNPITQYMHQAGQSVSWVSRASEKVLQSAQLIAFERKLVQPFARWQLLFMNFGPANFFENMQRSFLGGASLTIPHDYMGVWEFELMAGDLINFPWEANIIGRKHMRLEQAVVDPKTGAASVFKEGKIPLITRPIYDAQGNPVAKYWNFMGQDYRISDLSSWYDIWGDQTDFQRIYDQQVHFKNELQRIAPDEMGEINTILSRHEAQLRSISSFEPSDIPGQQRVQQAAMVRGPESFRSLSDITAPVMTRRKINKNVSKEMRQATEVSSRIKKGINDSILDGSLFVKGSDSIKAGRESAKATARDESVISLQHQTDMLKKFRDEFAKNPPTTFREFASDMENVSAIVGGIADKTHEYRRLTELRKAQLNPGKEVDNFEVGSAKVMADFLEVSGQTMETAIEQLEKNSLRAEGGFAENIMTKLHRDIPITEPELRSVVEDIRKLYPEADDVSIAGTYARVTETPSAKSHDIDVLIHFPEGINEHDIRVRNSTALWNKWGHVTGKNIDFIERFGKKHSGVGQHQYRIEQGLPTPEVSVWKPEGKPILTDIQRSAVNELNDVYRLELTNILSTRSKLTEIESAISRTPRAKRDNRFWQQQRTQKAAVWDAHELQRRRFMNLELSAKRRYVASAGHPAYIPDNIPPVTTKLTTSHLAYLFGTTGDDTFRGLTQVTNNVTIMPEDTFVTYVWNQADEYARVKLQKTANDIGFSEDAIRQLYKDMWAELGTDASTLTPDSPTMKQIDSIFDEVERNYAAVKVPESDVTKYKQYIEDVAKELEQTSMYKPIDEMPLSTGSDADLQLQLRLSELSKGVQVPGDGDLYSQVDKWFHQTDNDALQNIGKAATANKQYLDEIHKVLREKYPSGKIRIFRGSGASRQAGLNPMDREFINVTSDSSVAKDFEIWVDPETLEEYPAGRLSVEDVVINVEDVVSIGSVKESELIVPSKVLQDRIANRLKYPTDTTGWTATKEQAMISAKEQHAMSYPTYDDANIIDESMRAIFPFWNYEIFRYRWLPRTFMRTPGTLTGLARYMDYTDGGYIPIPGTDMQINPFRGSIWMGGLRSMYLKDFPEYYDQFPGLELFESLSRYGFYPGLPIQVPMILFGSKGNPELSELAPPWINTPLSALRALSPEHLGKVIDMVYPDRFRDYQTMLTLGKWGYDSTEIWQKKKTKQALTPEEEKLWLRAEADANGLRAIIMEQTGLFRYRPEAYDQMKSEFKLAIQDITGVSVQVQNEIDKQYPITGKRFADYYPLDTYQQKLLYSYEQFRQWRGVSQPLWPSGWQEMELKIASYYDEVEKLEDSLRHKGVYEDNQLVNYSIEDLNKQLVEGYISPAQWVTGRSELTNRLANSVEVLANSEQYKNIPKSLDEREAWMKEKGMVIPTLLPDQELLYYYYDLQPEMKFNPETGLKELDFDTYYAQVDNLLASMEAPYRERLLQRIQFDWTPMEKLYWQTNRSFFRPYNQASSIILKSYDAKGQYWIQQYGRSDTAQRQEIESYTLPSGKGLIADYNSRLREAHESMRTVDPELDAWLNFFGKVESFKTPDAQRIYNELRKQYLKPEMIR